MSLPIAEHPVRHLQELLEHAKPAPLPDPAATARAVVSIRFWGEQGPPSTHVHRLHRFADCLMVVESSFPFREGQILCVEVCLSDAVWQDRMKVVQAAPRAERWRLHLESTTQTPSQSQVDRDLVDPTRRFQSALRERAWIEHARLEIQQVAIDYLKAGRSWGLLGWSTRRRMARAISTIPGTQVPRTDPERRRNRRRCTHTTTRVIVQGPRGWRLAPGEMIDLSRGGLRVLLMIHSDPVGCEPPEADLDIRQGTPVVVGLGAEPELLWMPAEIVRVDASDARSRSLGLQFVTLKALQAFSG